MTEVTMVYCFGISQSAELASTAYYPVLLGDDQRSWLTPWGCQKCLMPLAK
jgi:hypothetical protein